MFDNYTLKARYYPVIILFLPIIVMGFFYSLEFESIFHFIGSVGVVGALTYLFSQLGRDQGKIKEPSLWESWGGSPTTQLLRIQNEHLDTNTKQRYHQKLQRLCPVPMPPDIGMETSNPKTANDIYNAWTKFLISQTRDTKEFRLLFKENTSYGFRRNLWGLKPIALTIIGVLLFSNYFYWIIKLKIRNPLLLPESFQYSTIVIFILLLFWLFIVTKSWVKMVAVSYAERLCECVDNL